MYSLSNYVEQKQTLYFQSKRKFNEISLKTHRFLQKNKTHRNVDEYDNRILFLTDASPTVGPGDLHITQLGQNMADANPR